MVINFHHLYKSLEVQDKVETRIRQRLTFWKALIAEINELPFWMC